MDQPLSPDDAPFRCVWIEKESINSVVISDAPEDLHQRMLVAASLSVNATGESGCVPSSSALSPPPSPLLLGMIYPIVSKHIYVPVLYFQAVF